MRLPSLRLWLAESSISAVSNVLIAVSWCTSMSRQSGDGRYAQVKSAVRPDEHALFYGLLAEVDGRHLSDIIRDYLIELAIHHRLLPEDYE